MKYELMMILKPFLPEDVRKKLLENIEGCIKKFKGEVEKEDIWGKRHLAYKIKGHEEGYYVLYDLSLPSNEVKSLEAELKLIGDILRFMIVRKEKEKE